VGRRCFHRRDQHAARLLLPPITAPSRLFKTALLRRLLQSRNFSQYLGVSRSADGRRGTGRRFEFFAMVDVRRFELPTPCLQIKSQIVISLIRFGSAYFMQHGFASYSALIGPKLDLDCGVNP
jgi:hypothetical protein